MKHLLSLLVVSLVIGLPFAAEKEKAEKEKTDREIKKELFRQLSVPVQQGQSGKTLRQAERLQSPGRSLPALL